MSLVFAPAARNSIASARERIFLLANMKQLCWKEPFTGYEIILAFLIFYWRSFVFLSAPRQLTAGIVFLQCFFPPLCSATSRKFLEAQILVSQSQRRIISIVIRRAHNTNACRIVSTEVIRFAASRWIYFPPFAKCEAFAPVCITHRHLYWSERCFLFSHSYLCCCIAVRKNQLNWWL